MAKKATATKPDNVVPIGENRQQALDKMFAEIDALGAEEGAGETSRARMAIRCTEWAAGGMADTGDAYTLYDRYMQSVQHVAAPFGGSKRTKERVAGSDGRKQNASKFRQFLKMGGLKIIDPVSVINRAESVIKDARNKDLITLGPFEALLNIARAQCEQTQVELTDEEMIEVNQPEDKGDPEEVDSLGAIVKQIDKHEEKYGDSTETTEARDTLSAKIDAMGGTTKQRKAKEKAEKKKKIKRK